MHELSARHVAMPGAQGFKGASSQRVDQSGSDVTLQAASGTEVRWKSAKSDEKLPLIHISKAPSFRIPFAIASKSIV